MGFGITWIVIIIIIIVARYVIVAQAVEVRLNNHAKRPEDLC